MPAPKWLTDLPRPALMAIGDSLLNGMRSYTINQALAAASIPARLGDALDDMDGFERFAATTYPEPILVDVEAVLAAATSTQLSPLAIAELLLHLGSIKRGIAANGRNWLARFAAPSNPIATPCFHNMAISGARIEDVFDITYGQVAARVAAMAPPIRKIDDPLAWKGDWPKGDPMSGVDKQWDVGDVHIALNSRHLRNPANRTGLDGMTVIDQVAARRPRILLCNLGPNHGIVDIVMRYAGAQGMAGLRAFAAAWPACARELAGLPETEVVIVLLMPRPSQVPCLMPPRELNDPEPAPLAGGYFPKYVSAIDPVYGGQGYSAAEMEALDRQMDAVNAEVYAATETAFAGSGKTLVIVSLAELIGRHDYKHRKGPKLEAAGSTRSYDNYSISRFAVGRLRGGICGFDHIHPSALGYRYVAEAVRLHLPAAIGSTPILIHDRDDAFLTQPDKGSLAALDALLPNADGTSGAGALPGMDDATRLMFRPPWLR